MGSVSAPVSRGRALGGGGTGVMGVLNVTPDSFSDGGRWMGHQSALDRGLQMWDEGAFLVDVGGESTRPGATRVTVEEEWRRIGPVVAALARRGVDVSVDTVNAETARRAVLEGAVLINDVSGGRYDTLLPTVAVHEDVALVIQHWRGFPSAPRLDTAYEDVVTDVPRELLQQVRKVEELGVCADTVVVDPGLGFAKGSSDSWELVANLDKIGALGYPVLIGASRKRFIRDRFGDDLDGGTAEVTRLAASAQVWAVRVHDVARNVRVIEDCG